MKNAMTKSTLREIKGSFSRWIANLAICALGVGFFCGLKICKEDFILTGDTFYAQHIFYDYELMSTLGLEEKDVTKMQALDGIAKARGSYSTDALFLLTDKKGDTDAETGEKVAKLHTLLSDINTPALEAGNLPDKPNQCVGDARYFSADDIGKKIRITDNNKQDTKDLLAYDTYELVGICESPLYLNFERGSTSLGNGSVATYLYIPEDGWDSEVYTEIYVCLAEGGKIYSDAYKKNADAVKTPLEDALETCASSRYDEIVTEANDKLSEAQDKLDDAKQELADAEKELADGEKKIRDGQKELDDNQKKLDTSKKELTQSKKDYETGLADYEKQKADAYAQLDAQKAQIDAAAGTPYYDQSLAQYQEAKAQADAPFEAADKELADAKAMIEAGEDKLNDGYEKLAKGRRELANSKKELADGRKELKDGKKKVADAEEEIEDARKKVDDIENPKTYVLGRDTNIGYVCFDNDTSIVDSIARVFPVFFFLVAALVCMTTMTRMIDEQRTQIGVLKALGYGKRRILGKYMFYAGSASLIGGLIGFFGGIYLFPSVIWAAYGMMYDFADLIFVVNGTLGALSILAAILCCVGTTIYCCYAELVNVPAELIRPKSPALGKRILLEYVPFIWNRLKFLHKVCLRNIFRYKKRFFMMVLGICGCTALLITAMGLSDSIKNIISVQYDEIFHNDYTVTFDRDMSEAQQEAFLTKNADYIGEALFLNALSVDVHTGTQIKSVNMIVADPADPIADFITLKDEDRLLDYPTDGSCIINKNLGENLKLTVGDTLTVYDSDMREMDLTIAALCENHVYNYVYIDLDTYRGAWGHPEINTAYVIGHRDADGVLEDPHADGAELMNARHVASVSITQDMRDRVSNMMASLDYVIILIMVCAGALAFIVLYNLTNINITERVREIATIKVLGFYPSETNAYVFRENIVLTAIAALVGMPVGKWFHTFVMNEIQVDLLSFDVHVEPRSYLLALVMTFAFALIVNCAMYFRLNKINMAESLKSIE